MTGAPSQNRRSPHDHRDSRDIGDSAEARFAALARSRGWRVTAAPQHADIDQHWDFVIARSGRAFKVDVKALKRIQRYDADTQDDWVWIELHGVRADDDGWLRAGKADLIAFEMRHTFRLVNRADLLAMIVPKVDMTNPARASHEARYRPYSRRDRHDVITLVESTILLPIVWQEWTKHRPS